MWIQCLGQEDPLEEVTATHSSILVWRIPWTEKMWTKVDGLQRVGYDESNLAGMNVKHLIH